MLNHRGVSGYTLITKFIFLYHVHAQTASNTNLTLQSSTSITNQSTNITWIRIRPFDPLDRPPPCNNCTSSEYEDLVGLEHQPARKRRKRRRNRRPSTQNELERPPPKKDRQHKKHSTRVHLERPVQFLVPPDEPTTRATTQASISQTTPNSVSSPARYLLPPYFDRYSDRNEIIVDPVVKKITKSETISSNIRGLTKFKNTVYYKDYRANDIDTDEVYLATTPENSLQVKIRGRTEFKPIVVQPTPSYSVDNVTLSNPSYQKNRFVSNEVADAGMQVVSMRTPLIVEQQDQSFQLIDSTNKQKFEDSQHGYHNHQPFTEEVHDRNVGNNRQHQPLVQKVEQSQPQLNREVLVPPPIQGTDEWMYELEEQYKLNFSSQSHGSDTIGNEVAPYIEQNLIQNKENTERFNYQSLPKYDQTWSKNREADQQRKFTLQQSTTTVPTTQRSSSPSRRNSTTMRSSGKGLDLAETQYFSDLPSEQEVSSLLQNDNQVIPGTAGKDYPVFGQSLLQRRRFACQGLKGYYADISTRCQVFYICNGNGAGEPMLCPNGTLFSQELLVCDWWYNVDC